MSVLTDARATLLAHALRAVEGRGLGCIVGCVRGACYNPVDTAILTDLPSFQAWTFVCRDHADETADHLTNGRNPANAAAVVSLVPEQG